MRHRAQEHNELEKPLKSSGDIHETRTRITPPDKTTQNFIPFAVLVEDLGTRATLKTEECGTLADP